MVVLQRWVGGVVGVISSGASIFQRGELLDLWFSCTGRCLWGGDLWGRIEEIFWARGQERRVGWVESQWAKKGVLPQRIELWLKDLESLVLPLHHRSYSDFLDYFDHFDSLLTQFLWQSDFLDGCNITYNFCIPILHMSEYFWVFICR